MVNDQESFMKESIREKSILLKYDALLLLVCFPDWRAPDNWFSSYWLSVHIAYVLVTNWVLLFRWFEKVRKEN